MFILRGGKKNAEAHIREAVYVLKSGGVIAFPTETTYGLGCDPRNAKAVAKIFRIKGRSGGKPLQLIAADKAQVRGVVSMKVKERRLAARYWPGPLTLLVRQRPGSAPTRRVCPRGVIGIRITPAKFAQRIIQAFGYPIAATSANRSGQAPAFSGRGVARAFRNRKYQPDLLLDMGVIPHRQPSTVALVMEDGTVEIIRRGAVRLKN